LTLSGKNLLSLISNILDLSKIEAGKVTVEREQFNLQQCINDVVTMQSYVAQEKQLALETHFDRNLPRCVLGDQLRLKQILLNLVGNAIKFTECGSVTVSTHLLQQGGSEIHVRITVQDSGIGIAPDAIEKIFKPFTQEDGSTTRKYGGTGLGLTISRRLAELLGGTISVESTQGIGSCFTLTLPFAVSHETFALPENPTKKSAECDAAPKRILLAEDKPINSAFGVALLNKLGHEVIVAENGRECLDALERQAFDFVLMDIQMPVMNGEAALSEIRRMEQESGSHLPVIAMTAYAMHGDRKRFLEQGFDGYVSKPVIVNELVCEMKRVVGLAAG
jgi:CheY-like chemotaxis protein